MKKSITKHEGAHDKAFVSPSVCVYVLLPVLSQQLCRFNCLPPE